MDGGRRKLAAEIVLFMECVVDVNWSCDGEAYL